MRLLHTSDWHLGRSFHGAGLLGAQSRFLDHLVDVVRAERIDAVLVAGDVYDRALPAPDSVGLLSDALLRLVDAGAQVVISSGNHDSATRLGFGSGLLARAGVHLRTSVDQIGIPVVIGDVAIHPIPYLEPAVAAGPLGTSERTHAGVLRAAMNRVRATPTDQRHHVVMAHAFVTGGVGSQSERDISVGGVAAVPPSVFGEMAYAALGHLHGPQQVDPHIRYSGSPLAMSFGEVNHRKSSAIVDLSGDEAVVDLVPAPVDRRLAVLRGDLEDLLTSRAHDEAEQAWCQVTITDPIRPMGAMDRIKGRFPHTLELRFEPQGAPVDLRPYAERLEARTELDVCCDFLTHVRGGAVASEDERALWQEAIDAARLGRSRSSDEGVVTPERSRAAGAA
ncbi:MAG TPA: exonuclease SbcCD subunit D [Phycicoccus elongatus]|jgi:exonuclease SbcD|uniref:Nuclease SbcCD subunit D n=1 Tax=Phycicoccus elongatus Lp2 TaxID=1193181 RepID=N0E560_9MICO|nr:MULTISPECIES: exonuclease SbcCD subunit D [Phycicoccus]MBK8727871.1 exonuclease SbcCD subunit D [Tetrasphaera sp.]MCA0322744.1 exonuclease SbcCD subunit D [Actinomycetota bacterium]MCB9405515.1 exonuclease SbcCD subunit D [Tetrasphaera sp.]MCO5301741.1 exonuclease SbcCD subunit D [Phycicoccus sp.]CCH70309.1 putative exonuclease [Phycicoccus elongatus Lp2]